MFSVYVGTTIVKAPQIKKIKNLLDLEYENVEQPEQQTELGMHSEEKDYLASDIWKAIDTQSAKNNLILSKCKPIDVKKRQIKY